MVRVKIEIDYHGLGDQYDEIGSAVIVNAGTHKDRPIYGNYRVRFLNAHDEQLAYVEVNDHLRSKGVWILLMEALNEAFGSQDL